MKARLYRTLSESKIECTACMRYCKLSAGQTGFCGVRKNEGSYLELLVYNLPMGLNIDPIEKKPVLHVHPGARILSFGTSGCNFSCQFCQNYSLSQRRDITSRKMTPEEIVDTAIRNNCQGIAYTYNEPTIFLEYAEDIGRIAHEHGLFNIFVTNGYESPEAVDELKSFLDFATIDLKGNNSREFYRRYISIPNPEAIYETLGAMLDTRIRVEVTNLIIPEIGEDLKEAGKMIDRIIEIAGTEIPLSFLRFHPDYRLRHLPPTPVDTLLKHHELARSRNMSYVYIGNVPGLDEQNTYCPECGKLLVSRDMMRTTGVHMSGDSKCPECGRRIPFVL